MLSILEKLKKNNTTKNFHCLVFILIGFHKLQQNKERVEQVGQLLVIVIDCFQLDYFQNYLNTVSQKY